MAEPRCRACGARVRPDERWCSLCLHPLHGEAPDDEQLAWPKERPAQPDDAHPEADGPPDVRELMAELAAYERAPLLGGRVGSWLHGGGSRTAASLGLLIAVLVVVVVLFAVVGLLV